MDSDTRSIVVLQVPGQILQSRYTPSVHAKFVGISPSKLWSVTAGQSHQHHRNSCRGTPTAGYKLTGRHNYTLDDVECTILIQGQVSNPRTVTLRLLTEELRKAVPNAVSNSLAVSGSVKNLADWWCVEHNGSWHVLSECSWTIVCGESFFGTAAASSTPTAAPTTTNTMLMSPFLRRLPTRPSQQTTCSMAPSFATPVRSCHVPAAAAAVPSFPGDQQSASGSVCMTDRQHVGVQMYGGADNNSDGDDTTEKKEVLGANMRMTPHHRRAIPSEPIFIDDDDDDAMDQDGSLVWPPKAESPQQRQHNCRQNSVAKISTKARRRPQLHSSLDTIFESADTTSMVDTRASSCTNQQRELIEKPNRTTFDGGVPTSSSVVVSWCSDQHSDKLPSSHHHHPHPSAAISNRTKAIGQYRKTPSSSSSSAKLKYQCPFDMFVTWWTKNYTNFPGDTMALKCWDSLPHSISGWCKNPMCRRYWTKKYGVWRAKQELEQRFTMEVEEEDGSITLIDPDEEALLSAHSQQLLHDEEILQQAIVEWSSQQKDPSLLPIGLLPPPIDVRTLSASEWTSQNVRHWLRRIDRSTTLSEDPLLYRIIKEKSIAGGRSFEYLCQFFHHQTLSAVMLGQQPPRDGVDVATVWVRRLDLSENPTYMAQLNQWLRDPNRIIVTEFADQEDDINAMSVEGGHLQSIKQDINAPKRASALLKKNGGGVRPGTMIPKAFQALRTLFYMEKDSQQHQQLTDMNCRARNDDKTNNLQSHDVSAYQRQQRQGQAYTGLVLPRTPTLSSSSLSSANHAKAGGVSDFLLSEHRGNVNVTPEQPQFTTSVDFVKPQPPRFAHISARALALSRSRGVRSIVTHRPPTLSSTQLLRSSAVSDMMDVDM